MSSTENLQARRDAVAAMAEQALVLMEAYRDFDWDAYCAAVQLTKLLGQVRTRLGDDGGQASADPAVRR